jgi:hypothetical protein
MGSSTEEFWEIESNTIGKKILKPFKESFAGRGLDGVYKESRANDIEEIQR